MKIKTKCDCCKRNISGDVNPGFFANCEYFQINYCSDCFLKMFKFLEKSIKKKKVKK